MKYPFLWIPSLVLAACGGGHGSGGSTAGFCADRQVFAGQLAPCGGAGGVTSSLSEVSCQSVYGGSSCSAADRTKLDAIGACAKAIGNCSPSNPGAFYVSFTGCFESDLDAGLEIGGVSASCNQALAAAGGGE